MTESLYAIAAIASAVAAVLAWSAKLWWSQEFAAAKDEIIKSKDAQIDVLKQQVASLQELTPMRIREYFTSVKQQLEEYNDFLQERVADARTEVANREQEITTLRRQGTDQTARIEQLQRERDEIRSAATTVENQLADLRAKYESADVVVFKTPSVDARAAQSLFESTRALRNALSHHQDDLAAWNQLSKYFEAQHELKTYFALFNSFSLKGKPPQDQAKATAPKPPVAPTDELPSSDDGAA